MKRLPLLFLSFLLFPLTSIANGPTSQSIERYKANVRKLGDARQSLNAPDGVSTHTHQAKPSPLPITNSSSTHLYLLDYLV
jgi:hypothetical protein